MSFLRRLAQFDNGEADRLTTKLIDKLRDSSATPIHLLNLRAFILAPDRSTLLKHHYLQSFLVRLRRDLNPNLSQQDLEDDLNILRSMTAVAANQGGNWSTEFNNLLRAFEEIYSQRSLSLPQAPAVKVVDISKQTAQTEDTSSLTEEMARLAAARESAARDRSLQRLASDAASRADVALAEESMSKITDEQIRRETTVAVYNPLLRKEIAESNWTRAQRYAGAMADPLGLALAFDRIGQAMIRAREDKASVKTVYGTALFHLNRTDPSEKVVKGLLILAKSLSAIDEKESNEVLRTAISGFNKAAAAESLEESSLTPALRNLIPASYSFAPDEAIDLTNMFTSAFREIAKKDVDEAMFIADGLQHAGMRSLLYLAVSKALLDETRVN